MIVLPSLPRKSSRLPRSAAIALVALASTALTGPAFGEEFPRKIPLSSLDGSPGFHLDGVTVFDRSGWSVAGDVNGDGFADVIVEANDADPHGSHSGSSYVVFGQASGFASARS